MGTRARRHGGAATRLSSRARGGSIHLSLVNETLGGPQASPGYVAPRTRITDNAARELCVPSRRARISTARSLRGPDTAADRLARARFPLDRTLDVRPYIKMASPPAWHPLAKPRPISRVRATIALRAAPTLHTPSRHRFRSAHNLSPYRARHTLTHTLSTSFYDPTPRCPDGLTRPGPRLFYPRRTVQTKSRVAQYFYFRNGSGPPSPVAHRLFELIVRFADRGATYSDPPC